MWPAQRDQGFGVMTHSPLAVGLLSGVYTPDHPPPAEVLYARGRAGYLEKEKDLNEAARRTLGILREVADAHGRTMAQTAINWVLSHPEVTAAVTGGDTDGPHGGERRRRGLVDHPGGPGPSRRGLGRPASWIDRHMNDSPRRKAWNTSSSAVPA